jgi:hypothetical protein
VIEDPLALTDACGRPTGERATGVATLSLCYHECDVEPVPVLVADCDVREECRPGAVRERFRIVVTDGPPELDSRVNCGGHGENGDQPGAGGFDPIHMMAEAHGPALDALGETDRQRLAVFQALCTIVDTKCAPPEHACVPIGFVVVGQGDGDGDEQFEVIGCGARVPILSNVDLLDLMLCLLQGFARPVGPPVLHYENGDGQSVVSGSTISVSARLTDASGTPLSAKGVTFRARTGGGSVGDGTAFAAEYIAQTGDDGRVSAAWQIGGEPGLNILEAEGHGGGTTFFHALAQ